MQDDLLFLYRLLRQQLEFAYAAADRENGRIDQITLDLMSLERTMAAAVVQSDAPYMPAPFLPARF
jgi:hypothetical protein